MSRPDNLEKKLRIDGILEFWFQQEYADDISDMIYRPAVLVECTLNFRSLRAGLNHSEEHNYTAWLPEGDLAIDWDTPAVIFDDGSLLGTQPDPAIPHYAGSYLTTASDIEQYQSDLVGQLVRKARLQLYHSSPFGLYSAPGQPLDDFLGQVAEAALRRVEPELKRLHSRFELQLEQVREAQLRKGISQERRTLDTLMSRNASLFESENRLAAMFSNLAGTVFGTSDPRKHVEPAGRDIAELREDLERVEEEASQALQALYEEYVTLANEYQTFEIGLQPNNVQVIRCALLWVPCS
jgi:hypothetical protein